MKKIILSLILVLSLSGNSAHANVVLSDEDCLTIIQSYSIDPKIKSAKGWKRIFKSQKWKKRFKLDTYTQEEIDCLEEYIVKNSMNIKSYNRFVGMELKI